MDQQKKKWMPLSLRFALDSTTLSRWLTMQFIAYGFFRLVRQLWEKKAFDLAKCERICAESLYLIHVYMCVGVCLRVCVIVFCVQFNFSLVTEARAREIEKNKAHPMLLCTFFFSSFAFLHILKPFICICLSATSIRYTRWDIIQPYFLKWHFQWNIQLWIIPMHVSERYCVHDDRYIPLQL